MLAFVLVVVRRYKDRKLYYKENKKMIAMTIIYVVGVVVTLFIIFKFFINKELKSTGNSIMAILLSLLWPLTLIAFLFNLIIDKFL